MRYRLNVQDTFDWEMPNHVRIQIDVASEYGQCTVNKNSVKKRQQKSGSVPNTQKRPLRYVGGVDIPFAKAGVFEKDTACAGLMVCTLTI